MTINQFTIMMLPVHMLIGAICGFKIKNFYLAIATPVAISLTLNFLLVYLLF